MLLEHRLSALLQLHLHSPLNTWLQYIAQRQLRAKTRKFKLWHLVRLILRDFPVVQKSDSGLTGHPIFGPMCQISLNVSRTFDYLNGNQWYFVIVFIAVLVTVSYMIQRINSVILSCNQPPAVNSVHPSSIPNAQMNYNFIRICIIDHLCTEYLDGLVQDCSNSSALAQLTIGLDNGLASHRRQAIIWTSSGHFYWCIYALFGLNGLKEHHNQPTLHNLYHDSWCTWWHWEAGHQQGVCLPGIFQNMISQLSVMNCYCL